MKKLLFVLFGVLLSYAATAEWIYDSAAKTLTQGTTVLQNVSIIDGVRLKIGNNKSNTTIADLDLSTGVGDGYVIEVIDDNAFDSNPNITSITFPETLITLGGGSFRDCPNLSCEIKLPSSLTGSLSRTFRSSPITGDIVVPDGITYMIETFYKTSITSLIVGKGVTQIGGSDGLCGSVQTITNVVFQSGCKMGQNEFIFCANLQTVTFHPGMSGAWIQTFKSCSNLTGDIVLPDGVTDIKETFHRTKITSFTAGAGLKNMGYTGHGDGDFAHCTELKKIKLNNGLQVIGRNTFVGCSAITELVVPDTVTTFFTSLSGCNALTNIVMPKGLETITSRVFTGSQKRDIYWRGYPKNGFTSGGQDTNDPMWDMYSKGACTNWIRPTDTGWKTFAETYPDYFYLPETKYGEGGWIGGYRSSAWQIVKWWHDSASIIIIR